MRSSAGLVKELAGAPNIGMFIDRAFDVFEAVCGATLVTFNVLDFATRNAAVSSRPFQPEQRMAVDQVNALLEEHPFFLWYTTQLDWSPRRLSDVAAPSELARWPMYRMVLQPIGASYSLFVPITSPFSGRWKFFVANRGDRDFSDRHLADVTHLQSALIALFHHLSKEPPHGALEVPELTRRERTVLGYLAAGLTADAIARRVAAQPATIRKHLQNIYAKLSVSDRLGAVMRARELGLLGAEDLARALNFDIRAEMSRGVPPRLPQHTVSPDS